MRGARFDGRFVIDEVVLMISETRQMRSGGAKGEPPTQSLETDREHITFLEL